MRVPVAGDAGADGKCAGSERDHGTRAGLRVALFTSRYRMSLGEGKTIGVDKAGGLLEGMYHAMALGAIQTE